MADCPRCSARISWWRGFIGTICVCGNPFRNEWSRWLAWSLLVDIIVVSVFLSGLGFWWGLIAVLFSGLVLWFVLDCRIDPVLERYPKLRQYLE